MNFVSTLIFGVATLTASASFADWLTCDATIRLLYGKTLKYKTNLDNCLINPASSLTCTQLCLIGSTTYADADCVRKCQTNALSIRQLEGPPHVTFPGCQQICEKSGRPYFPGPPVPSCVSGCEKWSSPQAYVSCYNVCKVFNRFIPNNNTIMSCVSDCKDKAGEDWVVWGRCGQIVSMYQQFGTGNYTSEIAKCIGSKGTNSTRVATLTASASFADWQTCDATIRLLGNIIFYKTFFENCLINPASSLTCTQLCFIGQMLYADADCVRKCQTNALSIRQLEGPPHVTFPGCQQICEKEPGSPDVPSCVSGCEKWSSPQAYVSCYNVCEFTLVWIEGKSCRSDCKDKAGEDWVLWGRCAQIVEMYTNNRYPGARDSEIAKCIGSKGTNSTSRF